VICVIGKTNVNSQSAVLNSLSLKMILFLLVLLSTWLQASDSAVPSFGRCPNVPGSQIIYAEDNNIFSSSLGIANFDKRRYLGVWYEYSNVFEIFQIGGTCVRATYTDEGDRIGVFNEQVNTM
jgi:hypothetical protein